MKTIIFPTTCFLCLFILFPTKLSAQNIAPDGFRGIKLGVSTNRLEGMTLVTDNQNKEWEYLKEKCQISVYKRKDDLLAIKRVKLKDISYLFFKNKLYRIHCIFDPKYYDRIGKLYIERYGKPKEVVEAKGKNKKHKWVWNDVEISLCTFAHGIDSKGDPIYFQGNIAYTLLPLYQKRRNCEKRLEEELQQKVNDF